MEGSLPGVFARYWPLAAAVLAASAAFDLTSIHSLPLLILVLAGRVAFLAAIPFVLRSGSQKTLAGDAASLYATSLLVFDVCVQLTRPHHYILGLLVSAVLITVLLPAVRSASTALKVTVLAYMATFIIIIWTVKAAGFVFKAQASFIIGILAAEGLFFMVAKKRSPGSSAGPDTTRPGPGPGPAGPGPGPGAASEPETAGREPDAFDSFVSGIEALPLTAREKQIVSMLLAGKRRSAIAAELEITVNTVKKHAANVYGKLEVGTREELISLIRQPELVEGR
ncbi:MAG: response regulator transcription factor [Rectinemataceae bacterium]